MVPAYSCRLGWSGERTQPRNNYFCLQFCLGESYRPHSLHPEVIQFSSSSLYTCVLFELLPQSKATSLSASKCVCGPFKRNCLGLLQPSVSLSYNPQWFSQPKVMLTSLSGIETLMQGARCGANSPVFSGGPLLPEISLRIFNCHGLVWDQLVPCLHPS